MAYATATDIEDRLGRPLDESEAVIVETRLEDTEALIKSRVTDLDAQVTAGTILERLVVMVESDVVLRLIRNPDGYMQESDGNYSYTIDSRVSSGRLALLPEEWTLLGIRKSVVLIAPTITMPTRPAGENPNYDFEPEGLY